MMDKFFKEGPLGGFRLGNLICCPFVVLLDLYLHQYYLASLVAASFIIAAMQYNMFIRER
jgi:hypothetical protein